MKHIENMLRNDLILEIRNFLRHIKFSTNNIWGKEVKLVDKNEKVHTYELQRWYVTVPIYEGIDIEQFIIDTKSLLCNYELSRLVEVELDMKKWNKYTMHQLCDWDYLEDEFGEIVRDNKVTFVKYAIILKDLEG